MFIPESKKLISKCHYTQCVAFERATHYLLNKSSLLELQCFECS